MTTGTTTMWRSRWAAVGAAVAITLGAGGIGLVDAAKSSGERAVYTAIEPCRLLDTRPAKNIQRNTPLGQGESYAVPAIGNNGECTGIPADTVALELNVTGLLNTAGTDFVIWSGAGAPPNASQLNLALGASATPNSVTTELDGTSFSIRNKFGTAHVIIDIVGVYQDHNHDDRYYTEGEVDGKTWGSTSLTNEPGIASTFRSDIFEATPDPTSVVETSIRVPSDGFASVTASGSWHNGSINVDQMYCQLQKGTIGPIAFNNPGTYELSDRNAPVSHWTAFTLTAVLPIAAADNPLQVESGQTFNLVCEETQGAVRINDVQISVTFFPTSYQPS